MNTPKQETSHRCDSRPIGDERSCLELMLRLQPFPCLVVETETAQPVLSNEEARRMLFDVPPGVAGLDACYATDADGGRIEPEQVIPYVVGRDADGDGVELTWHAPGRRQFFRVASRALPCRDGTNPLSMLSFLDLTGQKMAEGELRDAVEARDEFFSVATHELKDPLFSLQLSIQLLRHSAERQGPVPPHVLQHLDVSERQVTRLGRLIDNMLDVARIVNGRIDLDMETLDLCELAHQIVARFQGQATSSGAVLSAEPCRPVVGRFDRLKLEQVIGNLLSNAIKYGAGKPIVVRVRGEERWALLEVQDHGAGIAPEDQDRIFGRFQRASDGHKRASLGLGLYIVRSLVDAHGGSVRLRSHPGQGSTFTVLIPWEQPPCEVAPGGHRS
jgi:signal transduction histidine kinase